MERLQRELGVFSAVMLGLGSILGTGVFVSIALATETAGSGVFVAIVIASAVAMCNGLSSAQLASKYPVSGGTYEYGYETLNPWFGFTAGWMFLCAKSASAGAAAIGFAGYAMHVLNLESGWWSTLAAVGAVLAIVVLVLTGIRRSALVNTVLVVIVLAALFAFISLGMIAWGSERTGRVPLALFPKDAGGASELLMATALMFVAYTGYGRVATLGEEVREPRRTIPIAVVTTLIVSALLYVGVAAAGIGLVGVDGFGLEGSAATAPLENAALSASPAIAAIVSFGAVVAMLGVLLNLVLGLSRVVLAMARRGDLPRGLAKIHHSSSTPRSAVIVVGVVIAAIAVVGDFRLAWSFSAITVLLYYGVTNLAAIRLGKEGRFLPAWISVVGLMACGTLAVFVEPRAWIGGVGLLAAGFLWRILIRRLTLSRD